jgi:hypothetical protein
MYRVGGLVETQRQPEYATTDLGLDGADSDVALA